MLSYNKKCGDSLCSGRVASVVTGVTFRFSLTNTTQNLQARKQMEYDNNEHEETNNLIIITNRNTIFMLCMRGLCRKYSYGQLNENRIVRPCVCLHVSKVD